MKSLDESARAGWAKSLDEFPVKQAKEADSRGLPGSQVMKAYIKAVSDTGYAWPHEYPVSQLN